MEVIIGMTEELITKAQAIRYQVFTVEQNISAELDVDGKDPSSKHALVVEKDIPIATARLAINSDGSSVMARVAVLKSHRGFGVASMLVKALIEHAKDSGVSSIELNAHSYLRKYYEGFGFEFIQEVAAVDGHQLIAMRHQFELD